ncbi:MAG: hypothetical protein WEC33_07085, partial [Dehalococcoidia bacterium]
NDGSGAALYAGGNFSMAGSTPANRVAKWDGAAWSALGPGVTEPLFGGAVYALAAHGSSLVVGGFFDTAGGQPAQFIARWGCPPPPPCYPDCNGDALLNLADFGCFQTAFALAEPYADCNGDSLLNLADFGCFQTKFALGCP